MKKILTVLLITLSSTVFAGGESKEVCHDRVGKDGKPVIDKKTNKPIQDCKTIKVHKKLDGTKVPEKK